LADTSGSKRAVGSSDTTVSAVGRLPSGERLATRELAVERRVFDEVVDEGVPAAAGHPIGRDVPGGELPREPLVESAEGVEGVEHLAVTVRVGATAGDDVRAVGPVLADRPVELPTTGQRLAESRTEPDGRLPVDAVRLGVETQQQVLAVGLDARGVLARRPGDGVRPLVRPRAPGATAAGGFLDQPPRGGLPYPPGSSERRTT
jgi:hypothetical protein